MSRHPISKLRAYEYQHPFDRKALRLLKNTQGLSNVMRKVSSFGIETFSRIRLTGSGLRATDGNFPALYGLFEEACEVLDVERVPELYLLQGDALSMTVGVEQPVIAISNFMVDNFTEDELMFIFGHQLSYVKSESLLYQQLAVALNEIAAVGVPGLLNLLTIPVQMAVGNWQKMAVYTADRCGLLCCQNSEAAVRAMIKLAGQPTRMYDRIDVDEFRRQAMEFEEFDLDRYNKIVKMLIAMDQTHPPYVIRGAQFFNWVKSGDYERILERKPTLDMNDLTRCSFCGEATVGDETFCTYCGNRIVDEHTPVGPSCPKCQRAVGAEDAFCMGCGQKLGEKM